MPTKAFHLIFALTLGASLPGCDDDLVREADGLIEIRVDDVAVFKTGEFRVVDVDPGRVDLDAMRASPWQVVLVGNDEEMVRMVDVLETAIERGYIPDVSLGEIEVGVGVSEGEVMPRNYQPEIDPIAIIWTPFGPIIVQK